MKRNTVKSIKAALKEYDGCEFDVRLSKDGIPVLQHNALIEKKRVICTNRKDLEGVDTLADLLGDPIVKDFINKKNKTFWIEAKEDSYSGKRSDLKYCKTIAKTIEDQINKSGINTDNIYIISFCPLILDQFKKIKTVWIVPYLNSVSDSFYPRHNLLTVIMMHRSLKHYVKKAKKSGYNGLFFTKLYLKGFFSIGQPSIEKLIRFAGKDFILGTEAKTREEEKLFSKLIVVTDHKGKKRCNGRLICHRGLLH